MKKAIIIIIVLVFFSMTIILSSNHLNLSLSFIMLCCDELKYRLESRNILPKAHGKKYIYALFPKTSDFNINTISIFHMNAAP